MKIPSLAAVVLLAIAPAFAATTFPGLKSLLTEAEWKRAGLDRLTADELGVIDAALIHREASISAQHQTEVAHAQQAAATNPAVAAGQPAPSMWARFGLAGKDGPDWRDQPPLQARVVKWETPNRFLLDNGQAWESSEPIIYDLVGKDISIHARPNDRFALSVGDVDTTIRVYRVR
jgi:hypothetical protein